MIGDYLLNQLDDTKMSGRGNINILPDLQHKLLLTLSGSVTSTMQEHRAARMQDPLLSHMQTASIPQWTVAAASWSFGAVSLQNLIGDFPWALGPAPAYPHVQRTTFSLKHMQHQ